MAESKESTQIAAEHEVERFHDALGPFVVAAETTRMPMLFMNACAPGYPIIFVNDSFVELMGYEREELLAKKFEFCFAAGAEAKAGKSSDPSKCDDSGTPLELECRRKNGQIFLAAVYISPVVDADGQVVQYFSSFVDLTGYLEHKFALERVLTLQTELIHLSRVSAMGTMAATLAHELNQPLTAISNYAAGCRMLLATGTLNAGAMAMDIKAIEEGALRAGAIISRLRNMTTGGPSKRESFDLNDAVRESVDLLRVGACEAVEIESETDGVLMIEADRVQIQQVVINLVRNGCEAAAGLPDARVILSTRVEGDQAVVSVEDSGPGIAAERSEDLFEWANSAKPEGMGIGLSISRTIVEAHEGEIWLASREGGGTRFRFSVPLMGETDSVVPLVMRKREARADATSAA